MSLLVLGVCVTACSSDDSGDPGPVMPELSIQGDRLVTFEEEGGQAEVTVVCNMEWTAIMDLDWLSMHYDADKIYFDVPVNYETQLRKAKIAVTAGSGVNTSIVVVTVVQSGAGEAWVEFSPADNVIFEAEGGTNKVDILTNQSVWVVTKDDPDNSGWFSIVRDEESDAVTIVAEENTVTEERSATITITAGVRTNTATASLTIVQQAAELPPIEYADLSEAGTSNCYLVTGAGRYMFAAGVTGNGTQGVVSDMFHTKDAVIDPVSAVLIWQDSVGLIEEVGLSEEGDMVLFAVAEPFAGGNALIAVLDSDGAILWSWHIWMPKDNVAELKTSAGYTIMSMNLGAVTAQRGSQGTFGTLYQWGRKDPLPGSPVLTGNTNTMPVTVYDMDGKEVTINHTDWGSTADNTLTFAIQNPTVCISNYAQYNASKDWLADGTGIDALWGNPDGNVKENNDYINKGVKSIYDPCPVGWRVPPADVFRSFTDSGGYAWDLSSFDAVDVDGDGELTISDYDYGWEMWLDRDNEVSSYFPAAARYDGSYAMLMGSVSGQWGSYWGNTTYDSEYMKGYGFSVLSFQVVPAKEDTFTTTMSPNGGGGRADAYSVRCMKDDAI